MAQREIYAFDCGTTNWRIYRNSCADGPADTRAGDPAGALQCVALRAFDGRHLPAALLLDDQGRVRGQGKAVYEMVDDDPVRRPYLRRFQALHRQLRACRPDGLHPPLHP